MSANAPKDFLLASIVMVIPGNTPGMYSENFYKGKGIVNEEVGATSTINVPPLSRVEFDNGFSFEATQEKTQIKIEFGSDLDYDKRLGKVEKLIKYAKDLAREISHLPQNAIGLNFRYAIEGDGIETVSRGLPNGATTKGLTYVLKEEGVKIKVDMKTGVRKSDGVGVIVFDGNFHNDIPDFDDNSKRYEKISNIIDSVTHSRNKMEKIIDKTNV